MFLGMLNSDNINSFESLKYFLNSTFRIGILMSLYDTNKTIKELKTDLNKSESNLLHYLKDLEEKEIIEKFNDYYSLTSYGYIISKQLYKFFENWNSINNNIDFIDNHIEPNIPLDLTLNMDVWEEAEIIQSTHLDYNYASHQYKELLLESKNIKVTLPILSQFHIHAILESLQNNKGHLDLITSKLIMKKIQKSDLGPLFKELEDKNQISIWYSNSHVKLNKFLTCTENFISLFLFYNDGNCDDSEMLLVQDQKKVDKMNQLIDENKLNF